MIVERVERVRVLFCPHCMAHTTRLDGANRCGSCKRRTDRCFARGCKAKRLDRDVLCPPHRACVTRGAPPALLEGWTYDPAAGAVDELPPGSIGPFRVRATGEAESPELRATRADAVAGLLEALADAGKGEA